VLWIFGLVSLIGLLRRAEWTFIDRFLLVWLGVTFLASLFYAGGSAEHSLWFTLPLAVLSAYMLFGLFTDDRESVIWIGSEIADDVQRVRYVRIGRLITAIGMLALLFMFGMHLRIVSGAFLSIGTSVDGSPFTAISSLFERVMAGQQVLVRISVVWLMISALFMLIGYFLCASVWGSPTTLQGGALGLLVFGLFTGVSSGWGAAVSGASNPAELWHTTATSTDVFLLRRTLLDIAERQTGGFTELPIVAQAADDGVVAWVLRDFENARFTDTVEDAAGEGIAILPGTIEIPSLGGGYLGQTFLIEQTWSPAWLQGMDALAWWAQRRVRDGTQVSQVAVLWLRQDVFNGGQ